MVHCSKCGAENPDDSKFCTKCGAVLYAGRRRKDDECFGPRREEEECFGVPYGIAIVGIIIGLLIIMGGLTALFGDIGRYIQAFFLILIGVVVIALVLLGRGRRR